jgi:hypothetical protein
MTPVPQRREVAAQQQPDQRCAPVSATAVYDLLCAREVIAVVSEHLGDDEGWLSTTNR